MSNSLFSYLSTFSVNSLEPTIWEIDDIFQFLISLVRSIRLVHPLLGESHHHQLDDTVSRSTGSLRFGYTFN